GMTNSDIASATYTLSIGGTKAAPLTFNPASGTTFTSSQTVTISTTTTGATIKYTIDGTDPATSGTAVLGTAGASTASVALTATKTIRAIAVKSGMTNSDIASATYTLSIGGTLTVYIKNAAGSAIQNVDVAVSGDIISAQTFRTDSAGSFIIQNIPAVPQQITFSSYGYNSETKTVSLFAGAGTNLQVTMTPAATGETLCTKRNVGEGVCKTSSECAGMGGVTYMRSGTYDTTCPSGQDCCITGSRKFRLTGTVVDRNTGRELRGVTVTISIAGENTFAVNQETGSVERGSDGDFLYWVEPGDYQLGFDLSGYELLTTDSFTVGESDKSLGNIGLTPSGASPDGGSDTGAIGKSCTAYAKSGTCELESICQNNNGFSEPDGRVGGKATGCGEDRRTDVQCCIKQGCTLPSRQSGWCKSENQCASERGTSTPYSASGPTECRPFPDNIKCCTATAGGVSAVIPPTIVPSAGTYTGKVTVSMNAPEGRIFYTTNGDDPSYSSQTEEYLEPFDLTSSATVTALASTSDGVSEKTVAVFTIVSGAPSGSGAGEMGISGRVYDSVTGRGIGGVGVSAIGKIYATYTESDGSYTLRVDEGGTYRLRFTKSGYSTKDSDDIEVIQGEIAPYNENMLPVNAVQLCSFDEGGQRYFICGDTGRSCEELGYTSTPSLFSSKEACTSSCISEHGIRCGRFSLCKIDSEKKYYCGRVDENTCRKMAGSRVADDTALVFPDCYEVCKYYADEGIDGAGWQCLDKALEDVSGSVEPPAVVKRSDMRRSTSCSQKCRDHPTIGGPLSLAYGQCWSSGRRPDTISTGYGSVRMGYQYIGTGAFFGCPADEACWCFSAGFGAGIQYDWKPMPENILRLNKEEAKKAALQELEKKGIEEMIPRATFAQGKNNDLSFVDKAEVCDVSIETGGLATTQTGCSKSSFTAPLALHTIGTDPVEISVKGIVRAYSQHCIGLVYTCMGFRDAGCQVAESTFKRGYKPNECLSGVEESIAQKEHMKVSGEAIAESFKVLEIGLDLLTAIACKEEEGEEGKCAERWRELGVDSAELIGMVIADNNEDQICPVAGTVSVFVYTAEDAYRISKEGVKFGRETAAAPGTFTEVINSFTRGIKNACGMMQTNPNEYNCYSVCSRKTESHTPPYAPVCPGTSIPVTFYTSDPLANPLVKYFSYTDITGPSGFGDTCKAAEISAEKSPLNG
ncbi:MAG: carboxypeptidase regulatory-like domain-containing protein, partial [Candidatus Aenigmarchaeota archaeon]|nr:carboxypeptidase regulatory-like domain-containing protein [Candidatus Aenigmarchaeota archaeon]